MVQSEVVQTEVRAVQQQVATLIGRYPASPAESSQVDDRLHVGPLSVENHQVAQYSAADDNATAGENGSAGVNRRLRIAPAPPHACAAVIVPQLADGRFGLVVRYRFAPAKWSLEFPRALSDDDDETWRNTCARVLDDATGWLARDMTLLGSVQVDPSCMATRSIVALAQACTPQRVVGWDPNQMIAGCIAVTSQALDLLIRRGDVECAATLSALCLVNLHAAEASGAVPKSHINCGA